MAEEKTFSVGVQTSSPKKISVTSNVSENYITASPDTGLYYSRLSEKWATGEGLVENKDYSSKTYATQAKEYAEESKMYSESASLDLGNLENKFTEYNTQLDETVAEGLVSLQTSVAGLDSQVQVGKTEINNVKEQAITTITAKTDDSLDTLETKTQESIERIENTSGGDYVAKSGDTMTGTLNLAGMSDDGCQQRITANDYGVMFRNDNENFYMLLTNTGDPFGHWNDFRPFTLNFAGGYITTGTPTTSDNSSKLATTAFVKSVLSSSGNGLANITKAQTGAIDFNVGLKIRWGRVAMGSDSKTYSATFSSPFTTSSPAVSVFRISGGTTTTNSPDCWCRGVSSTGFELYKDNTSASLTYMYIAVGY